MLKLNKQSLGETAAGKVVNLLANDVSRFDFVTIALHYFWIAPIQVILASYFMWRSVGVAAFAGIVSMLLFTLPLQSKSFSSQVIPFSSKNIFCSCYGKIIFKIPW